MSISRTPKVLGPRTRRHPSFSIEKPCKCAKPIAFGTEIRLHSDLWRADGLAKPGLLGLLLVETIDAGKSRIDLTKSKIVAINSY
jgi:hypothetical protein